jgi:hypothetical protein
LRHREQAVLVGAIIVEDVAQGTRRVRVNAPARQSAKAPGGAKRQREHVTRVTLHLGEQTAKRLAVHAALVGRNSSRVADEVLLAYLCRHGRGKEAFGDSVEPTDTARDIGNIGEV